MRGAPGRGGSGGKQHTAVSPQLCRKASAAASAKARAEGLSTRLGQAALRLRGRQVVLRAAAPC